jgi:hypothetical protein
MFLLIGNSGSNHNYVGLRINEIEIKNELTYHNYGTHSSKNILDISYLNYIEVEKKLKKNNSIFMVCFASMYNKEIFNLLKKYNIKIIQILIEKNQECLLINWQEKLRINPMNNKDKSLSKEWEEQQKNAWQNYTKFPIERAIVRWTYNLYNKEFIDVKKNHNIDSFFLFGSLYESYKKTKTEFEKFSVNYLEEEYNNWKTSQKIIFDSWSAIKNNLKTPNRLQLDYQKGIAIALQGIKENINEHDCWIKYEPLLH